MMNRSVVECRITLHSRTSIQAPRTGPTTRTHITEGTISSLKPLDRIVTGTAAGGTTRTDAEKECTHW